MLQALCAIKWAIFPKRSESMPQTKINDSPVTYRQFSPQRHRRELAVSLHCHQQKEISAT